jgi:4-amino-4-deoxy-L-arabinose transferase-like glycosyltransferase
VSAATRSGPHQVLLAFYALFTLAAGARAAVQLASDADRAPVAYTLSAVAAVTYALGWYAIRRASAGHTGLASVTLWVELAGVLVVGTLSLVVRRWFPDASVWSDYGIGYGFVPAVLPVAGLLWLRRQKAAEDPGR